MLRYTFDIATRSTSPIGVQFLRRGDEEQIEVTLKQDGEAYELQPGETLTFVVKARSAARSADPLIAVADDAWENEGNVYTAELNTDGEELLAAIDALDSTSPALEAVGEIVYHASELAKPRSSPDLRIAINNDVERDTDAVPVAALSFWQRLKARFSSAFTKDDDTQIIDFDGGGGGVWGEIDGTLADQTDLQTELDGKAAADHQHVIGDVTDLQTELDGKAPSDRPEFTTSAKLDGVDLATMNDLPDMSGTLRFIAADGGARLDLYDNSDNYLGSVFPINAL